MKEIIVKLKDNMNKRNTTHFYNNDFKVIVKYSILRSP